MLLQLGQAGKPAHDGDTIIADGSSDHINMDKATFVGAVETEWAEWQSILARVGSQRMEQSGVEGEWSLKDIIAHISFYEHEMVGLLQSHELAGSDLWELPTEERNRILYTRFHARTLDDVLTESARVHERLMALLNAASDEDLVEAQRFKNMPSEWIPWQVIASNTFEHYRDHAHEALVWLRKPSS